jgi:two-component system cell cycle response regulator DivK
MMAGDMVLVVEDNDRNMKLVREVLRASGYRVLEASTGHRALELATRHQPALVLLDIRLPDIDGVDVLCRLRADEATASTPVVAITAQAMKGDRERLVEAGFDRCLQKPLDIDELLTTVALYCAGRGD